MSEPLELKPWAGDLQALADLLGDAGASATTETSVAVGREAGPAGDNPRLYALQPLGVWVDEQGRLLSAAAPQQARESQSHGQGVISTAGATAEPQGGMTLAADAWAARAQGQGPDAAGNVHCSGHDTPSAGAAGACAPAAAAAAAAAAAEAGPAGIPGPAGPAHGAHAPRPTVLRLVPMRPTAPAIFVPDGTTSSGYSLCSLEHDLTDDMDAHLYWGAADTAATGAPSCGEGAAGGFPAHAAARPCLDGGAAAGVCQQQQEQSAPGAAAAARGAATAVPHAGTAPQPPPLPPPPSPQQFAGGATPSAATVAAAGARVLVPCPLPVLSVGAPGTSVLRLRPLAQAPASEQVHPPLRAVGSGAHVSIFSPSGPALALVPLQPEAAAGQPSQQQQLEQRQSWGWGSADVARGEQIGAAHDSSRGGAASVGYKRPADGPAPRSACGADADVSPGVGEDPPTRGSRGTPCQPSSDVQGASSPSESCEQPCLTTTPCSYSMDGSDEGAALLRAAAPGRHT